ncbi:MAG: FAD-dependent oxidoreductase [Synechococcaceae cyanobacterium]|nr:FAD-dependent oxidoreductase [Synechococcaceae cyanobacterium]
MPPTRGDAGPTLWRLSEVKLPLDHDAAALEEAICRRLRLPASALRGQRLVRRSVDARRKQAIRLVYVLDLELDLTPAQRRQLQRRFAGDPHLRPRPDDRYQPVLSAPLLTARRPVVVGAGPCGYFAALLLAQMGLRPLLLERGQPVRQRTAETFRFWRRQGPLQSESNAQFGEGGAGTFSDGKLYSQISEPQRYVRKVLEELVEAGAHPEILTRHRPHIGTFKLATVVRGLRARIEALGGEVWFGARVSELEIEEREGQRCLRGLVLADGRTLAADRVVLAIGHSARDSFAMLERHGVALEQKPFAVGLRIEHPQALIDEARWGACAGHPQLGAAEYKLVRPAAEGRRAVYSFCMCPGGLVVGAASEPGGVVTNGMSQHSRNERNANSALVVPVSAGDVEPWARYPGDPLAGVAFQRHWEARAFMAGGGTHCAPAQWVGDFLRSERSSASNEPVQAVRGSYQPGLQMGDLADCLPEEVVKAIREALPGFDLTLPGYAMDGALLTGVETRTSSPLRIPRQPEGLVSVNTQGLYPAGEGAGYAGGILSAAIDGIKVAEALALSLLHPPHPGAPGGSACGRA